MTIFDTSVTHLEPTWARPDTDLWVATVNGDYAGMIEFNDGRFVCRNHIGDVVANSTSIPAAKEALRTHLRSRTTPVATGHLSAFTTRLPRLFGEKVPRTAYMRSTD
jgi:hypothetical protein